MNEPIAVIDAMVQQALERYAYIGKVAKVAAGLVFVIPPWSQVADPIGLEALINTAGLVAGDRVTVLQQGASHVVVGKLQAAAPAPPPAPGPPTATGVYLGVQAADPTANLLQLVTFEEDSGRNQALAAFRRDFTQTIDTAGLTVVGNHGATPFLTWQPAALSAILAGDYDGYLTDQATRINNYGKPVFIRLAPDPNTNLHPWGASAPVYIRAWLRVQALVKSIAPKTAWVWSVYAWPFGTLVSSDPQPFYPGDAVVDWVGLDGYNSQVKFGSWQTFTALFGASYAALTAAHRRPLMLAEWGCDEDARKAAWLADALQTIPALFPQVGAEVYTNEDRRGTDGLGTNWAIESNAAAQAAFRAGAASAYYLSGVH